jgi:hypothetical protein
MRAKIIFSAAALSLAIVGAAVYFRNALTSSPAPNAPSDAPAAVSAVESQPVASAAPVRHIPAAAAKEDLLPPEESGRALTASNHTEYVLERKTQLMDLTTSDDPGALKTILSELNNPDPDIRKTALASAVDVGNPDAVPALQNQLAWSQDPQEKVDIQKAIDFLQLPSADQVNAEITAAKAAEQAPPSEGN